MSVRPFWSDGSQIIIPSEAIPTGLGGKLYLVRPEEKFKSIRTFVLFNPKGGCLMPEELIIRNCSRTLAGLKTGSMFSCPYACEQSLREEIRTLNRRLAPKGLRILPLQRKNGRALIYVFRPHELERDLCNRTALYLLRRRGYPETGAASCLCCLVRRFQENREFPHEVGLFLGYPPEDVCAFIDQQAHGCKFVGCWKVYGNEGKAKKTFDLYKKCTRVYCEQWAKGCSIERLTVTDCTTNLTKKSRT